MNRKFLSGFAVGALCAMLVCTIAFLLIPPNLLRNVEPGYDNSGLPAGDNDDGEDEDDASSTLSTSRWFNSEVRNIFSLIDSYFYEDVSRQKLEESMLQGLMAGLDDPYAYYYSPEEFETLLESVSGVYCGIGAIVSQDVETKIITVLHPYEGSPSYEAGMLPGDIIYKVDGEDVTGMDLTEVVARMKGEENTQVKVTVYRDGVEEPIDITITRGEIVAITVQSRMLDNNIGYIQISEFEFVTVEQFTDALDKLEAQGAEGLIIDVRDNPGGSYDAVVDVLDRLIPKGKLLVYTLDKNNIREEKYSMTDECIEIPLVVLVNERSASASEIFAGTLSDYEIATLVGTKSFGKGIVQTILPLINGNSGVKLTTSHYYLPLGTCIHGQGIEPDVTVEIDEELEQQIISSREYDNQIDKAVEILLEKIGKK